jgi:manganese transport protein
MYRHILVPLDLSPADAVVLRHVRELARFTGAKVTLIHVADGHVARNLFGLDLAPSPEMVEDQKYLDRVKAELCTGGLAADAHLARGEPAHEILAYAGVIQCDLIAMSTHGHGMIGDLILGSVAHEVRHRTDLPVLMIRASKEASKAASTA